MTEPQTHDPATEAAGEATGEATRAPALTTGLPRPGLVAVLRHQRKVILVGLVLMVACFWFMGQLGEWRTAALTAFGILLALLNHLATERWLGRLISSGGEPTRGTMAAAAIPRLTVLSVVALGAAVLFWPNGIGLLLGLALFRLI